MKDANDNPTNLERAMTDPRDTITITRKLAFRLLGELEQMAEQIDGEWGDSREPFAIIEAGDMPKCYYQLRAALSLSRPNNDDLIDIERDND